MEQNRKNRLYMRAAKIILAFDKSEMDKAEFLRAWERLKNRIIHEHEQGQKKEETT